MISDDDDINETVALVNEQIVTESVILMIRKRTRYIHGGIRNTCEIVYYRDHYWKLSVGSVASSARSMFLTSPMKSHPSEERQEKSPGSATITSRSPSQTPRGRMKQTKPNNRKSITKTYLYSFDPLKPHFYIVKLEFTGVYIIFHISAQNIDCGYSLQPPRRGGSNEYPQSMFWAEIWKISKFLSENFQFLEMKFSIYLNRRVFVMSKEVFAGT